MDSNAVVPFAEPLSHTREVSAYYNDSHWRLQRETRKYVDTYITPNCEAWEAEGSVPTEVLKSAFPRLLEHGNPVLICPG